MNKIIGLFDLLNFKNPFQKKRWPNLALMKISQYYKQKNYKTEFYSPVMHL